MKKCNKTRVKSQPNFPQNLLFWVGGFLFKTQSKLLETEHFNALKRFNSTN